MEEVVVDYIDLIELDLISFLRLEKVNQNESSTNLFYIIVCNSSLFM